MTSGQRRLIQLGIREMIESLPDPPFTGLSTKAGVRISTSACYEYTRLEGGSSQAIHDIVSEGNLGRKVKILDLETGNVLDQKELSDLTHGEYIFWRCLEVVLGTPLKELGKVFLVTAKEPGKARTVTKAHTAVKCVLDVVNGICSWPLSKGFRSSSSGMLKESHGWNFFKELFSFEEMLFKIKNSQKEHIGPTTFIETLWYQDVYVSSTDYETATDYERHDVASLIGNAWMLKCGIPSILRGIVTNICYKPRIVEFTATGLFANIGTVVNADDHINSVILERGVLMGDPLTKVVLHLVNILVRTISILIINKKALSNISIAEQSIFRQRFG
jgi:hypothetical protein